MGALVLRQPLGLTGCPGDVGARSWRGLRGIRHVESRGIFTCGSIWGARRRGGRETRCLRERWRPGQDWALAQLHLDRLPQILEVMPAVGDLDGIGGTLCHPRSVRIGAAPATTV